MHRHIIMSLETQGCTCIGHLVWSNKNRNDPISVAAPKVGEASTIVTVTVTVAGVFALKPSPMYISLDFH